MNIPDDAPYPVRVYLLHVNVAGYSKPTFDRYCRRWPEHAGAFAAGLLANLAKIRWPADIARRLLRDIGRSE